MSKCEDTREEEYFKYNKFRSLSLLLLRRFLKRIESRWIFPQVPWAAEMTLRLFFLAGGGMARAADEVECSPSFQRLHALPQMYPTNQI